MASWAESLPPEIWKLNLEALLVKCDGNPADWNEGSFTDVALDRAGGGDFVDFRCRGAASVGTDIGSGASKTGDRTVEPPSAP
jgi:hypothetical protein